MKSPLTVDKETCKKYDITPDIEPSPMQKLAFVQNQLQELQTMQWRARVDILHATRLTESDNEVLKNKGLQQIATHINEAQQFSGAIRMIKQLVDELRTEYPELAIEE